MEFILKQFTRQLSFGKKPALKQYSLKEVAHHCTMESCWMVIRDKVYDLTDFIEYHPGGQELMLEYAGTDATNAFNDKPHTRDATTMLEPYLIGELVPMDCMYS
jgi:cytochrome b5